MGDWSETNYDMLVLIAKRFNLIEDYLNFASVCKSWRCAATKENFNTNLARVPWLMLAEEEGNSNRQLVSPYNGMIMKKKIPKASGKRCMETMGWLVMVGKEEGEISLLHPFSGVQIELPHQNTTENYHTHHQTGDLWTYFHKAVLSASPSHTSDYLLMVIEGDVKFLSYWRPGNLQWTRIINTSLHVAHRDVIYFDGKFYAVDWSGRVLVCDIESNQTQVVAQLAREYNGEESYIVESLGTLFIVVRYGVGIRYITDDSERIPLTLTQDDIFDDLDEELTYGTTNIRVFEVDLVTGKLTQTKELGDTAFFIGHNASRSVQPSQFPGIKPNHIYFTDDYWESYLVFEEGGGLDMGVFNLADGTILPFPHYKGVSLSPVCPPTWVTPTLC
ncbi:F-box protein SKIP23-like [Solanum stenotomum]|uniref:F-box protein SKIP23-like n=1 Tax=Solanum stenotomum TaxID=172797 RepID=UPI0020D1B08E|nr:F-box protein SKIP23-like [Solanum stenotomum]